VSQLAGSISATALARLWSALSALALLAMTARALGPDGRGIIAAATAWTLLYSTLGFLSLGQVALHLAAQERGNAWLPPVLGTLIGLTFVLSALGWAVAGVAFAVTSGDLYKPLTAVTVSLAFLMLPFSIWEQYGSALLMAVNRLDVYNRAVIIGRAVTLLLAVLALVLDTGVYGILVAMLIGQAIVALRGARHLITTAERKPRVARLTGRKLLGGGLKLHANAVGAFMLTSTDVLVISHYRGAAETGVYQLSTALLTGILILPQAAAWVLYARIADTGAVAAWAEHRRVLVGVSAIMVGVGAVTAVASPYVLPAIVGPGFAESVTLLQILLLALPALTMSAVLAPQWVTRGLFLQVSAITVALGLLNLIGNLLLVPQYGAYGSAWSTLATSVGILAANAWMAVRCEREWRTRRPSLSDVAPDVP
jgi:O-antigen/teichoic acid export membrane protein